MGNVETLDKIVYRSDGKKRTLKGKILRHQNITGGYLGVNLSKNGKQKTIRIHKLVCLSFVANPENKPFINHIDGNKKNNKYANLEWCTAKENSRHSWDMGMSKSCHTGRFGNDSYKRKGVAKVDTLGIVIEEYMSIVDAANKNNIYPSNIINVCKGRYHTSGGFVWRYVD